MALRDWVGGLTMSTAIWITGTGIGILAVPEGPTSAPSQGAWTTEAHSPSTPRTEEHFRLFTGILGRNLAVYLWLLCGLVSGGLTTVAVLTFNGVLFGHTTGAAIGMGIPAVHLAWLLLPHGIPEIGTFLVAGAIGVRGTRLVAGWMAGSHAPGPFSAIWRPAVWGALVLAGAAAIEVRVTVPLAEWGMQP
ncbi:MAG: stage II sporulation protein M [Gammaproteobacteria bacterium]|nr:stage II sporulation protein M [Gammaproteobacteria bacterium]